MPGKQTLRAAGLRTVLLAMLLACAGGGTNPPTPVLTSLTVSIGYDTMRIGEAALATAEGRDQSGAPMRVPGAVWWSSDASVATVSYVGYVNAVGLGATKIRATALGKAAEVTVHVLAIPVAGVVLSPTAVVLEPGGSSRLVATPIDAAGRALSERRVAWLSSDSTVVRVSDDGLVTAIGPGVTGVSAISETEYATARIRVSGPAGPVAKVTILPEAVSLLIGQTSQLDIRLEDVEGDLATGRSVAWTSTAPNVASVSATGVVQAIARGSAIIEAVSEGARGTAAIVVADPADAITIRVAAPVVNEIVSDTLLIVASVSARNPIAKVHAKVFNRETDLTYQSIAQGRALAWVGRVYLRDVRFGPYVLVISATDIKGNEGVATVAFIRGAREGNGGTTLPPRSK